MLPKDAKILIADDLSVICQLLKSDLNKLGYSNVATAPDGVKAWECYVKAASQGDPFALVICDLHMPLMDGNELLAKIRGLNKHNNALFFMITGEAEKDSVLKAAENKVDAYLVKPVSGEQVETKLKAVFSKKAA